MIHRCATEPFSYISSLCEQGMQLSEEVSAAAAATAAAGFAYYMCMSRLRNTPLCNI